MNKHLSDLVYKVLERRKLTIVSFAWSKKNKAFDLACRVKKETDMTLTLSEASQIYSITRDTAKVPGDLAEVGVYTGASAKLVCEAKGNRILHLFDTFQGLPELSDADTKWQFHKNQYSCSLNDVKSYLHDYMNVYFYEGFFPQTATPVMNTKFSLVHLDVDLYESTKNGLNFFYPRMNPGGIIISHDYVNSKGVHTAFDEFFKDKPEPVIELAERQCIIIKL